MVRDSAVVSSVRSKEFCLPVPSDNFLRSMEDPTSFWSDYPENYTITYCYLVKHLDSLMTKKVTKTDSFWGPIHWEQEFSKGVKYQCFRIPEAGMNAILRTRCKNKEQFFSAISIIIESEIMYEGIENVWNSDSTKFYPKDMGVGCYYDLRIDSSGFNSMHYHCGC